MHPREHPFGLAGDNPVRLSPGDITEHVLARPTIHRASDKQQRALESIRLEAVRTLMRLHTRSL